MEYKKILIITRHGERCDYLGKVPIFGKDDPELSENGKLQTKKIGDLLAKELKQLKLDKNIKFKIISSPFVRAIQTGRGIIEGINETNIFNKIEKDIYIDYNLIEIINSQFYAQEPIDCLNLLKKDNIDFQNEFNDCKITISSKIEELPKFDESVDDLIIRMSNYLKKNIPILFNDTSCNVFILSSHANASSRMNNFLKFPPANFTHLDIGYCDSFIYEISDPENIKIIKRVGLS